MLQCNFLLLLILHSLNSRLNNLLGIQVYIFHSKQVQYKQNMKIAFKFLLSPHKHGPCPHLLNRYLFSQMYSIDRLF